MESFFNYANNLPDSSRYTARHHQTFNKTILEMLAHSMYEQIQDELLGEVVVAAFQAKMQVSLAFRKEGSTYIHLATPEGRQLHVPITLENCIAALQWIEG